MEYKGFRSPGGHTIISVSEASVTVSSSPTKSDVPTSSEAASAGAADSSQAASTATAGELDDGLDEFC